MVSLALITSVLRTRKRKKKAIQEQELKEHEQNSLSSHYLFGVDLGLWRGFDSIELCLGVNALALVLNEKLRKLGWNPKYSVKDGFKRTLEYLELENVE